MTFRLAREALTEGYRVEAFETIGSTNAVALERAKAGDPGQLWVVSKRQEAGRGRRGRAWATEDGNLAATLLISGHIELARMATLGFVAGLSLSQALDTLLPNATVAIGLDGLDGEAGGKRARVELKWPNDVLAGGAKLAGILIESTLLPDGSTAAAIGIGVNVASAPEGLPYPATSVSALAGSTVAAEDVFEVLSAAWVENAAIWNEGRGLSDVRTRWLDRAAGLGGQVAVKIGSDVVRGVFETIDEDCRFVIRQPDGTLNRITAGDVHFGTVASA